MQVLGRSVSVTFDQLPLVSLIGKQQQHEYTLETDPKYIRPA